MALTGRFLRTDFSSLNSHPLLFEYNWTVIYHNYDTDLVSDESQINNDLKFLERIIFWLPVEKIVAGLLPLSPQTPFLQHILEKKFSAQIISRPLHRGSLLENIKEQIKKDFKNNIIVFASGTRLLSRKWDTNPFQKLNHNYGSGIVYSNLISTEKASNVLRQIGIKLGFHTIVDAGILIIPYNSQRDKIIQDAYNLAVGLDCRNPYLTTCISFTLLQNLHSGIVSDISDLGVYQSLRGSIIDEHKYLETQIEPISIPVPIITDEESYIFYPYADLDLVPIPNKISTQYQAFNSSGYIYTLDGITILSKIYPRYDRPFEGLTLRLSTISNVSTLSQTRPLPRILHYIVNGENTETSVNKWKNSLPNEWTLRVWSQEEIKNRYPTNRWWSLEKQAVKYFRELIVSQVLLETEGGLVMHGPSDSFGPNTASNLETLHCDSNHSDYRYLYTFDQNLRLNYRFMGGIPLDSLESDNFYIQRLRKFPGSNDPPPPYYQELFQLVQSDSTPEQLQYFILNNPLTFTYPSYYISPDFSIHSPIFIQRAICELKSGPRN